MKRHINAWFKQHAWKPFDFQERVWHAMRAGQWGLLHASTGSGKTLATWFGALLRCADQGIVQQPGLKILWITPMRALASDTANTLQQTTGAILPGWRVQMRTSDTRAPDRREQRRLAPDALVTTPESLSLMLSQSDAQRQLGNVQVVIVDEWHELLATKRGVQVQLAIARLARWQPDIVIWGMSATLGKLSEALAALTLSTSKQAVLLADETVKQVVVDTILPANVERFAWAGHLGFSLVKPVVDQIRARASTLVFVNTRAQAERWYQAILEADSTLAGEIALHHGSLDYSVRQWVEQGLKQGQLRAVVCTASLDLGVDFLPVDQVIQIGSAKGVARLLQRAGRSGHAPGRVSRITLVPTHSLEILEAIAVREALAQHRIESRSSPQAPLDVLVQHLVTIALGGGFLADDLLHEVRTTHAYRHLTPAQWQWALDFISQGGCALTAYPDYQRARPDELGVWRVTDGRLARRHRMSIGTIVSDAMMQVRFWSKRGGARIGQVEESFIARLKPGDCFLFAGGQLELVRVQDMTAYVRRVTGAKAAVPRWVGGNMPLSTELADSLLDCLEHYRSGNPLVHSQREWLSLQPLLALQQSWSDLPGAHHLLVESWVSREGTHIVVYPFAGRQVHLGLSNLIAWRLAQHQPLTFSLAVNDYGFEMLCAEPLNVKELLIPALWSTQTLVQDIESSLNASEMAQRRFREIARVAGLVFQGYPGAHKSARQVQASSGLFFQVFQSYDPDNQLLAQAHQEVLTHELDVQRLRLTLERIGRLPLKLCEPSKATPFAFPLIVQRWRERLSSEKLSDRVARLVKDLQKAMQ
jgi:ATP-dependent helicase Lhr and Lhr-like helicase